MIEWGSDLRRCVLTTLNDKITQREGGASRREEHGVETAVNERGLHLDNNEWHETMLLYVPKQNFDREIEEDHERYVVFMSSEPVLGSVGAYIGLYNQHHQADAVR